MVIMKLHISKLAVSSIYLLSILITLASMADTVAPIYVSDTFSDILYVYRKKLFVVTQTPTSKMIRKAIKYLKKCIAVFLYRSSINTFKQSTRYLGI